MIFDKLAGFVERSRSEEMKKMMNAARLFHFPVNPHEVLPRQHTPEQVKYLQETFFLPFPIIAVEDNASCVVIKELSENPVGIGGHNRLFLECMTDSTSVRSFCDGVGSRLNWPEDMSLVNMGVMRIGVTTATQYECEVSDVASFLYHGKNLVEWVNLPAKTMFLKPVSQNWITAIEEILLLNSPDKFILEKSPSKIRGSMKRIARSHDRPIYTILHPNKIREAMHLPHPEGTHGSPAPHERRAHMRHLSSDKFVKAKGKDIFIKAMWVGPSENKVRGHRYRVMLDM